MRRFWSVDFGAVTLQLVTVLIASVSTSLIHHRATSTCKGYHAELKCPKHHGIAIRTILYGTHREYCNKHAHGMEHCCSPLVDDCVYAHKAAILSMNTYCSGLDSCIGSSEPTGEMPDHHCGFQKPVSYMKVNYDCVPERIMPEFCRETTYTDSHLYITSPSYPTSMNGGNKSCNCLVTAGKTANVNISIQAIDILFTGAGPYNQRICEQKLVIRHNDNPNDSVTIDCNGQKMYGFREIFHGTGNKWLLTLTSHFAINRGRLWLLVKAVDNKHRLTVRCGSSIEWADAKAEHIPGIGENTRKYLGVGVMAGTALCVCALVMLLVASISWQCQMSRKSRDKKTIKCGSVSSDVKPPPSADIPMGHCNTTPQNKSSSSKKNRKSSKSSYATVPRNLDSPADYPDHSMSQYNQSLESFPQSPTVSSQQEFLHDYSVPPPPSGPYENICMNSATFPRGRPLVPDPYAQYYATIQPRSQRQPESVSHSTSTPWEPIYNSGPDDEEWPPPYVPEEANTVENALYGTATYY